MLANTLTPEGAMLLRQVRDHLVKYPEQLEMANWECGTKACIAGHCDRFLTDRVRGRYSMKLRSCPSEFSLVRVVNHLGWDMEKWESVPGPLRSLFFDDHPDYVAGIGIEQRINNFLWQFGYMPEDTTRQAQAEAQGQERLATA